jgi:hypothetical protein
MGLSVAVMAISCLGVSVAHWSESPGRIRHGCRKTRRRSDQVVYRAEGPENLQEDTMKYLMAIYANQQTWAGFGPEEQAKGIAEQDAFNAKFFATGELLGAYGLSGAERAKVVRVRNATPAVTDGPYLESKEYLASYYLLDVDTEQRALDIAAEMPFAAFRGVEVWPIAHEAAAPEQ